MDSSQQVSVTITPGPLEVTFAGEYLLVTDTRGGGGGWGFDLTGATIKSVKETFGSAPGMTWNLWHAQKDTQVGPGDSTGGQWLFTLDRDESVAILFWTDTERYEWSHDGGTALTKVLE